MCKEEWQGLTVSNCHAGEHKDCRGGHSVRNIPSPEMVPREGDEDGDEDEVMVEIGSPRCRHPAWGRCPVPSRADSSTSSLQGSPLAQMPAVQAEVWVLPMSRIGHKSFPSQDVHDALWTSLHGPWATFEINLPFKPPCLLWLFGARFARLVPGAWVTSTGRASSFVLCFYGSKKPVPRKVTLCAVLTARLTVPGSKPTHYFYNCVKAMCLMPRTFSGVWHKAETSNEAVQSCRRCWNMNGGYSPVVYSPAIKIRFWICFFHWEFTASPEHSWKYEAILVKFSLWKIAPTYLKIYLRMAK